MRFFRVVAGVTVAAALSWVAFANAQVAGADNESNPTNLARLLQPMRKHLQQFRRNRSNART